MMRLLGSARLPPGSPAARSTAAMLAACNSSGRESSRVPIDYTLVKNIKKPNGARPGMVIYETYYTMLTTPDHAAAQKLLEK